MTTYRNPIIPTPDVYYLEPEADGERTSLQPLGFAQVLVSFEVWYGHTQDIRLTGVNVNGEDVDPELFSASVRREWIRAIGKEIDGELAQGVAGDC